MKSYPIEIGGKTRNLRFTFNSFCAVEQETGKSISELGTSLTSLRALLWAGLRWEERGLTTDRVGGWIDEHIEAGGDLQELVDNAMNALEGSGLLRSKDKGNEPGEQ